MVRESMKMRRSRSQSIAGGLAKRYMEKVRGESSLGEEDKDHADDLASPRADAHSNQGRDSIEAGMSMEGPQHDQSSEPETSVPTYGMDDDGQGLSDNVMYQQNLAEGLQAMRMKANDNTVSYEANDSVAGRPMNRGGEVQEDTADTEVGNKPELDWQNDGTGEPMSSMPSKPAAGFKAPGDPTGPGLSEEAKQAIARKRASRMYGKYSPR